MKYCTVLGFVRTNLFKRVYVLLFIKVRRSVQNGFAASGAALHLICKIKSQKCEVMHGLVDLTDIQAHIGSNSEPICIKNTVISISTGFHQQVNCRSSSYLRYIEDIVHLF